MCSGRLGVRCAGYFYWNGCRLDCFPGFEEKAEAGGGRIPGQKSDEASGESININSLSPQVDSMGGFFMHAATVINFAYVTFHSPG